jgi:hypothetical protein
LAQVVVVHGVGGPKPASAWLGPLNERFARLGYPRLGTAEDTIRVVDYTPAFTDAQGAESEDTYKRPSDRDRLARALQYAADQSQLLDSIRAHAEESWFWNLGTVPSWLAEAAAFLSDSNIGRFREVKAFVDSADVRNAACQRVLDAFPTRGSVVLVAHSLGSVVSARTLRMLPRGVTVDLFLTVGSPLAFSRYRQRCGKVFDDFPYGKVRRWVNLYSPRDPVPAGRGISGAVSEAIDVCTRVDGDHDLEAYMSHPAAAAAIGPVVFGAPKLDAGASNTPARRVHQSWYPILLSTAYTFQIVEAWDSDKWREFLRFKAARAEFARRTTGQILDAQQPTTDPDGPFGAGRYPSEFDLVDRGAPLLKEAKLDEGGLLVLAVGLLLNPLIPPFDVDGEVGDGERVEALEATLNVVRDHTRGSLTDKRFATQTERSLDWAKARLRAGGGFPWGAVLIGVGLAALAATGVGLAAAAPAGLAGAASITATLAAFGPGGMVGGIATLAALTGTAGALTAAGVATELQQGEVASAQQAGHKLLARLDGPALTATLAGMLAVAHAQPELKFPSTEPLVREAVLAALSDVTAERNIHRQLAPDAKGTKQLERRVELLERALAALDEIELPTARMQKALRKAAETGTPPRELPSVPGADEPKELPSAD